ncbi:hypothetical protein J4464_05115 [Candidatus Woesearchaeota archaeon]|nr:hypothetical protein [Candidatus Woesearchaeota archaeon]
MNTAALIDFSEHYLGLARRLGEIVDTEPEKDLVSLIADAFASDLSMGQVLARCESEEKRLLTQEKEVRASVRKDLRDMFERRREEFKGEYSAFMSAMENRNPHPLYEIISHTIYGIGFGIVSAMLRPFSGTYSSALKERSSLHFGIAGKNKQIRNLRTETERIELDTRVRQEEVAGRRKELDFKRADRELTLVSACVDSDLAHDLVYTSHILFASVLDVLKERYHLHSYPPYTGEIPK